MSTTTILEQSVLNSIPGNIQENYPIFVEFMQEYYKWLYNISPVSLITQTDEWIKNISDDPEYITQTMHELGYDFDTIAVSKNLFFDRLQEFTNIRGTEESYHLMFRLLYGVDIEIRYPRDELFYTSNTNTVLVKRLMCKVEDNIPLQDKYYSIKGLRSDASGIVEQFSVLYVGSSIYLMIDISNYNSNDWILGEAIYIYGETTHNTLSNTGMYVLDVTNPGNLYNVGDRIVIDSCSINGIVTVDSLTTGNIPSVNIINGGHGYKVGDTFTTNPNGGFFATVTSVTNGVGVENQGVISEIKVTNAGYGYSTIPTFVSQSKGGVGAILEAVPSKISGIRNPKYVLPYALCSSPTASVSSSTGSGFQAEFHITNQINTQIQADQVSILGVNGVIQNSDGFHEFSYVISSPLQTTTYMNDLKNYLHPSGFQVVGTTPVIVTNVVNETTTSTINIIQV